MAQKNYTYRWRGAAHLAGAMLGSGSFSTPTPPLLQLVTWDEAYKDDLDYEMLADGWEYVYEGTPPAAKTIAQIQSSFLGADASAIPAASGWVTVASKALTTRGGSSASVQAIAVADTSGGQAQARILVNGGAFGQDTVLGAVQYDIHDSAYGAAAFNAPVTLPSGDEITYTFALQIRVTGASSTATPRKGSGLAVIEHKE